MKRAIGLSILILGLALAGPGAAGGGPGGFGALLNGLLSPVFSALTVNGNVSAGTLGSDLIVNGTFDTDLSGWTAGANWSQAGGKAVCTINAGTLASAVSTIANNGVYQMSVTVVKTAGTSIAITGGGVAIGTPLISGTYTYQFRAISAAALTFTPTADFAGNLDVVTSQLRSRSVVTDLGSGGTLRFGSGSTADTLVWAQNTALTAGARDMVFVSREEDGTTRSWKWNATTSRWNFDAGITSVGTLQGTAMQLTAGGGLQGGGSLAGASLYYWGSSAGGGLANAVYGEPTILGGLPGYALSGLTYLFSSSTLIGLLNQVQSPDFAAATGWTLTNTTISGGKLNKLVSSGAGTATQAATNLPILTATTYLIRLDVDSLSTGHDISLTMGGTTFGTITAEGSNQWFRGTTVNATGALSLAWATGETGICDNIYVYRLAGKMTIGGSFWNQVWTQTANYTVLDGDHVLSMNNADARTITLPSMATMFDVLTSSGRELIIENQGAGTLTVTVNPAAADSAANALCGADSIHLAQYKTVILRATSATHLAVQR